MHSHLVPVEVGVERLADERVDLDSFAFDQFRLERLDAEAVQRRCAVEEHRVFLNDLGQYIPNLRTASLHHLLGRLDVLGDLEIDQALHHERLEQLESHDLGKATLVQLQLRTDHDHRPTGVVDTLSKQILTETPLLALEHVGQRLQRPVARTRHRTATSPVVEQRIDGFLEHPLLVVHDDFRSAQIEQSLETVVAVDHAAIEIVQVRGGKPATIELHHRTKIRWNDWNGFEDHRLRIVLALEERLDDLEALRGSLPLLRGVRVEHFVEEIHLAVEIDPGQVVLDRLSAHATFVEFGVAVVHLTPELFRLDQLLRSERTEPIEGLFDQLYFVLCTLLTVAHLTLDLATASRDLL